MWFVRILLLYFIRCNPVISTVLKKIKLKKGKFKPIFLEVIRCNTLKLLGFTFWKMYTIVWIMGTFLHYFYTM